MIMRVVIVEDDNGIREALTEFFAGHSHVVSLYSSAKDMLFNGFELPDVFLIDWLMPGINGLDLCKRLKGDPITGHIPVVLMSAAESKYLTAAAEEAGVNAIVIKPFSRKKLLTILKDLVSDIG